MTVKPDIFISIDDCRRLFEMADRVNDCWGVSRGLFEELERATLLRSWAIPPNVATMHSLVQFQNEDTGRTSLAKLVYPHEMDGSPGKLSVLSPAGAALLGLSAGDRIAWPIGDGSVLHYQLIQVLYQPKGYS